MQQHSQPIHAQGQGHNLSATGGLLAFLFGAWVGSAVSRRYEIPSCHFPHGKRRDRDGGDSVDEKPKWKSNWQSRLPPEVREGIEKVKAFERKYRKLESTSTVGGENKPSKEAWPGEWSV